MSVAISIRIPENLAKQLEGIAKETDRPRSYVVRKALEAYMEDYADFQVALDRLRDKSDQVISSRELKKSLGL